MNTFKIADIEVGSGSPFFILGPCGLENEDFAWRMARALKEITDRVGVPFIFKASTIRPTGPPSTPTEAPVSKKEPESLLKSGKNSASPSLLTSIRPKKQPSLVSGSTSYKSPPFSAARLIYSKLLPRPGNPSTSRKANSSPLGISTRSSVSSRPSAANSSR